MRERDTIKVHEWNNESYASGGKTLHGQESPDLNNCMCGFYHARQ